MSVCQAFSIVLDISVERTPKVLSIIIIIVLKSDGEILSLVYFNILQVRNR